MRVTSTDYELYRVQACTLHVLVAQTLQVSRIFCDLPALCDLSKSFFFTDKILLSWLPHIRIRLLVSLSDDIVCVFNSPASIRGMAMVSALLSSW